MKLLLMDAQGTIHNTVTKEYPLEFPQPGWSQQNPEDWKKALFDGLPKLLKGFDASCVEGIDCGGQMHGLVVLDEHDNVIRPAILWNDGRTAKQVDYLNTVIGKDKLSALTANAQISALTRQNPVAITVNGKEDTVLLSHEDFREQLLYIDELEAKLAMYSHPAQAMDDIKLGRVQSADDVFSDIFGELENLEV